MDSTKQKIVITGAPSTGKSTTLFFLQSLANNQAIIVPESARLLLSGGFPAPSHEDIEQIRAFQQVILQLQSSLEIVFSRQNPDKNTMIFDRASLDGAGFWPRGIEDFMQEFKLDIQNEYAHYQAVLFFQLPEEKSFGGVNQLRFHNYQQCMESEIQLKKVWGDHPHFIEIKATKVFEDKIKNAIKVIEALIKK